mgnify:CR=1 FL=1
MNKVIQLVGAHRTPPVYSPRCNLHPFVGPFHLQNQYCLLHITLGAYLGIMAQPLR